MRASDANDVRSRRSEGPSLSTKYLINERRVEAKDSKGRRERIQRATRTTFTRGGARGHRFHQNTSSVNDSEVQTQSGRPSLEAARGATTFNTFVNGRRIQHRPISRSGTLLLLQHLPSATARRHERVAPRHQGSLRERRRNQGSVTLSNQWSAASRVRGPEASRESRAALRQQGSSARSHQGSAAGGIKRVWP